VAPAARLTVYLCVHTVRGITGTRDIIDPGPVAETTTHTEASAAVCPVLTTLSVNDGLAPGSVDGRAVSMVNRQVPKVIVGRSTRGAAGCSAAPMPIGHSNTTTTAMVTAAVTRTVAASFALIILFPPQSGTFGVRRSYLHFL